MAAANELEMRRPRRESTRGARKKRPRVVKELIRIGVGPGMLYLIAGTDRAVKLQREDVQKLETDTRKHIEELYEKDLVGVMERLGIESISLNEDEKQIVRLASKYVLAGYFLLTNNDTT